MNTYTIDMIITDEQSTLTKIIQTIRKLQFALQNLHLNKEDKETTIKSVIYGERDIDLLNRSLKKIEGVHSVCSTTQ